MYFAFLRTAARALLVFFFFLLEAFWRKFIGFFGGLTEVLGFGDVFGPKQRALVYLPASSRLDPCWFQVAQLAVPLGCYFSKGGQREEPQTETPKQNPRF